MANTTTTWTHTEIYKGTFSDFHHAWPNYDAIIKTAMWLKWVGLFQTLKTKTKKMTNMSFNFTFNFFLLYLP